MSKPESLKDSIERAMQAQQDPAMLQVIEYEDRVERQGKRAENLRRAAPPLTDTDVHRIIVDDIEPTTFVGAVRQWYDLRKPVIILSGSVGRGKSFAAAFALSRIGGVYLTAQESVRIFAAKFGDEVIEQERALACRCLVLDDVGTELPNDRVAMAHVLLRCVDERRQQGRRTIITTNSPRSEFRREYNDPRLHSRLDQSSVYVSDTGDDMRVDA